MTSTPDPVYDSGLQTERTLLAWQRTALALIVVSAVGLRFTVPTLGLLAVVLGGAGMVFGLLSYGGAHLGYRRVHRQLIATNTWSGNGWPQICLALAALLLGCLALAYVW